MAIIRPLPPRKERPVTTNNLKKITDLIGKTDSEIKNDINSSIYIDDVELFKANFDLFERYLRIKKDCTVCSEDLELLKFIEDNLKEPSELELGLVDDGKNKDRAYVDASYFEKCSLTIPMIYALWDAKLNPSTKVSSYHMQGTFYPVKVGSFETLSSEKLKKLRELISKLYDQWGKCSELEKIILVSNYLQDNVQYVNYGNKSEGRKGMYFTDSKDVTVDDNVFSPETVLFQNFGVCGAIANATTILLNNPDFDVNVRNVRGGSHVWNSVEIDGKYYYMDNTWCITRNDDQYPESLKAASFSSEYLLFGIETADAIGHHIPESVVPIIETYDYSQEELKKVQKQLVKKANFSGYNRPVFESRLEKN